MGNYFLSYSRSDKETVDALARDLEALGHWVWYDQDLPGGVNWWNTVLHYIRETDGFLLAVSDRSIGSRACRSELQYAEELHRPVLPIAVTHDFSDSHLPPSLGQINRVNYDPNDRNAAFSLSRAIAAMRQAPPLPDPLPTPPEVPASYMFDMVQEIDTVSVMDVARQQEVMSQLRQRYDDGLPADDVGALVSRFRRRDDLLVGVDRELESFQHELGAVPPPPTDQGAPPRQQPPQQQPQAPPPVAAGATYGTPPATHGTPAAGGVGQPPPPVTDGGGGQVNGAWWLAPIFFGIIGGAVAYFVLKDDHPDTARNMLIAGVVASIVWFILIGAGGA